MDYPRPKLDLKPPPDAAMGPEEGWTKPKRLVAELFAGRFVYGDDDPERYKIAYYVREADGHLVGKAWFGPKTEGPPGHAHGGSMAALLDEAMGAISWESGHTTLAARFNTRFKKSLVLGTLTYFEAWVKNVNGRKVEILAKLHDAQNDIYAEADGLFIILSAEHFTKLAAAHQNDAP
jgi:acyl-coenzyme A thioesterase PaaI-like protein